MHVPALSILTTSFKYSQWSISYMVSLTWMVKYWLQKFERSCHWCSRTLQNVYCLSIRFALFTNNQLSLSFSALTWGLDLKCICIWTRSILVFHVRNTLTSVAERNKWKVTMQTQCQNYRPAWHVLQWIISCSRQWIIHFWDFVCSQTVYCNKIPRR